MTKGQTEKGGAGMTVEKKFSYWADEDRDRLRCCDHDQKINWFKERVQMVLIRPLEHIVTSDIMLGRPNSSALLIVGVAICCAIEAMGRFILNGRPDRENKDCFKAFAHKYMSPDLELKRIGRRRTSYSTLLWRDFRNGIAHGFTVKHGGFFGSKVGPYFNVDRVDGRDVLKVNPYRFYADFRQGFDKYLRALRNAGTNDPLRVNFLHTFDEIFIEGR